LDCSNPTVGSVVNPFPQPSQPRDAQGRFAKSAVIRNLYGDAQYSNPGAMNHPGHLPSQSSRANQYQNNQYQNNQYQNNQYQNNQYQENQYQDNQYMDDEAVESTPSEDEREEQGTYDQGNDDAKYEQGNYAEQNNHCQPTLS
jgi:hypothetical protein